MRVALIAPPFHGSARGLPLGLAQLAASLEQHDFEVHALDLTLCQDPDTALRTFLSDVQPDLVGISTVCATYLAAVETAATCRDVLGPSVSIVGGGPHVTFGADAVLRHRHDFDICVLGEAEYTIVELCRALASGNLNSWKSVSGIAYRDGSEVRRTPPRSLAPVLDDLPFPSRTHFPQAAYGQAYLDAIGTLGTVPGQKAEVIASRGCPYPCGFCSTKEFWQRSYRTRSPHHVVDELERLQAAGCTDIYFNDDIFTVRRDWTLQICDEVLRRNIKLRWACGTRVDRVDEELLKRMAEAGCVYVYYGVETGDNAINRLQQKKATTAKIEEAYDLLRGAGIYSSAAIIFGLPGESWETARSTVDWLRDTIRPDEVWISKASCYPGTELARGNNVSAHDYEHKENCRSRSGLPYGTGGIYTPFFHDVDLVGRIWDYVGTELSSLSVAFGDDHGLPSPQ